MAMEYSNNKMLNCDPTSALPESVLCRILSFLDMVEVVRTSLVSRRWRYLWASVPVLNFDDNKWSCVNRSQEDYDERFLNFVDKVLFLRDSSKVSKLVINSGFCVHDRVVAWLTVAARRQFQEIHLRICPEDPYPDTPLELPHLLFTSAITLFELEVVVSSDISSGFYQPIKVPNSVSSSPQLKTLRLDCIRFPKGNLNGEFIISCPLLENLSLIDCDQRHLNFLVLAAPQLKNLVIEVCDPDWIGSCHIKIWTPNLISLFCRGFCYRKYSLINYSSLNDAKISFLDEQPGPQDLDELLRVITCARTIKLSFVDSIYKLNDLSNQFSNLGRLTLEMDCPNKLCISAVLQLLKHAPSIEVLILDAYELEDYEEVVSFQCSHLKYVEIGRLKGCELKFLKFLLKNALVLKELKIKMSKGSSVLVRETLGKKLLSLPRTSARTNIVIGELPAMPRKRF